MVAFMGSCRSSTKIATRPVRNGRKTPERKAANQPQTKSPPRPRKAVQGTPAPPLSRSRKQGPILVRLGVRDLVDHEADTTLGYYVRDAIADLDGHHSIGGGDSKHREEVDNRVGAPTEHRHHLRQLDFTF